MVKSSNTFKEQEKFDKAIASLKKAIELQIDYTDAYCALGLVMKEKGNSKEAITNYRKVIELKPDFGVHI